MALAWWLCCCQEWEQKLHSGPPAAQTAGLKAPALTLPDPQSIPLVPHGQSPGTRKQKGFPLSLSLFLCLPVFLSFSPYVAPSLLPPLSPVSVSRFHSLSLASFLPSLLLLSICSSLIGSLLFRCLCEGLTTPLHFVIILAWEVAHHSLPFCVAAAEHFPPSHYSSCPSIAFRFSSASLPPHLIYFPSCMPPSLSLWPSLSVFISPIFLLKINPFHPSMPSLLAPTIRTTHWECLTERGNRKNLLLPKALWKEEQGGGRQQQLHRGPRRS